MLLINITWSIRLNSKAFIRIVLQCHHIFTWESRQALNLPAHSRLWNGKMLPMGLSWSWLWVQPIWVHRKKINSTTWKIRFIFWYKSLSWALSSTISFEILQIYNSLMYNGCNGISGFKWKPECVGMMLEGIFKLPVFELFYCVAVS